jgi:acetolactate synthase-1/2/3 large subunit
VKQFIQEFLQQGSSVECVDRLKWIDRCKEWKARYPFVLPEYYQAENGLSMYAFSELLSDELAPDDVILPGNAGFSCEIFLTALKAKAGQRIFHNKGTGAMGFSQPAAIGACIASNRKRTVCVDGDGGFQMNIQELETVKRLNLPIKFFVINNQGYASIRSSQQNYFHHLSGADATSNLTFPDLLKISRAYGLEVAQITDVASARETICNVLNTPGPVVCDVKVIPDEPRLPRLASAQKPDGSMVSRPLEDMFPFLPREEFLANMIVPPLVD